MKKLIVIILALGVVGVGGYFAYQKLFPPKEFQLEDYLPKEVSVSVISEGESIQGTSLILETKAYKILELIKHDYGFQFSKVITALSESGDVTYAFSGVDVTELEESWQKKTVFGNLYFQVRSDEVLLVSTKESFVKQKVTTQGNDLSFFGEKDYYMVTEVNKSHKLSNFLPFLADGFNSSWAGVLKGGVKIEGEDLYIAGLAEADVDDHTFLSSLKNQNRLDFLMDKVISDKTAMVSFFSLTDGVRFRDDLLQYFYANEDKVSEDWVTFKNDYGINIEELFYAVEGQAGVAQVFVEEKESKLFYLPLLDEDKVVSWLKETNQKMNGTVSSEDSLYRDVRIGECPINDFSSILFGKEFSIGGQEKPSYIILDGYCIFGELYALRQLVIDYEEDEVWGRSIDMKESVQSHVSPCQLGMVCNPHFLPQLMKDKQWFFGGESFSEKVEEQKVIALEYAWDGNDCFVDFSISGTYEEWHNDIEKELLVQEKNVEIELDTVVLTKPLLVTNKNTKQKEVLLLDADNRMVLIAQNGKKRWSKKLEGTLVGNVKEVDLYKNGKIQYLLGTTKKVYCLDRLGRDVEGFPWELPNQELISGYSVIDYDRSKKYRFLVAGVSGDLYLYDKYHKNLKGWQPAKSKETFATAPTHLRVRGKDYIAGQYKNGSIEVRRRNAALVPHFPKELGAEVISEMYIEKASDFETTYFTSVLKGNLVKKVNLYGELASKKQFATSAKVGIVDVVAGGIMFSEQTADKLTMYSSGFKKQIELPLSEEVTVQVYRLKGKSYYFVRQVADGSLSVCDYKGKQIDIEPIFSSSDIALLYFAKTKTYKLFFIEGNKLKMKSLKLN